MPANVFSRSGQVDSHGHRAMEDAMEIVMTYLLLNYLFVLTYLFLQTRIRRDITVESGGHPDVVLFCFGECSLFPETSLPPTPVVVRRDVEYPCLRNTSFSEFIHWNPFEQERKESGEASCSNPILNRLAYHTKSWGESIGSDCSTTNLSLASPAFPSGFSTSFDLMRQLLAHEPTIRVLIQVSSPDLRQI